MHWEAPMRLKLVVAVTLPLVFASAPAMPFGLLPLVGSIAGLAVGAAGGAALSSSGVGPAGQPGATAFPPTSGGQPTNSSAWATTRAVGGLTSLLPSGGHEVPQTAIQVRNLGWVHGSPETLNRLGKPLQKKSGVDQRTVRLCRDALAHTVAVNGAVRIEAASAGRSWRGPGATTSPLTARVLYRLPAGYEAKQAVVTCQVSPTGVAAIVR
jgi:hypothetical protein